MGEERLTRWTCERCKTTVENHDENVEPIGWRAVYMVDRPRAEVEVKNIMLKKVVCQACSKVVERALKPEMTAGEIKYASVGPDDLGLVRR